MQDLRRTVASASLAALRAFPGTRSQTPGGPRTRAAARAGSSGSIGSCCGVDRREPRRRAHFNEVTSVGASQTMFDIVDTEDWFFSIHCRVSFVAGCANQDFSRRWSLSLDADLQAHFTFLSWLPTLSVLNTFVFLLLRRKCVLFS